MSKSLDKSTILIIDDMADSIAILNQILADEYRVLFALNGSDGLKIAKKQQPNIILLDIIMPDIDGYEVCKLLKADPDTRDIPIIFISSKDQDEDQEKGFQLGAVDFLSKPIGPASVKIRVKNQLKLRQIDKAIYHKALYDGLTDLPNRNLSLDRLNYSIAQDCRKSLKTALIFIDLDKFKIINDSLGHDAGDILLIEAALRLKSCVRKVDTVGRLGGDEFIIILPGLEKIEDTKIIADNIMHSFTQPINLSGIVQHITVSMGIAFSPDDCILGDSVPDDSTPKDSNSVKRLLAHADTAMYKAKNSGRNSYYFYQEQMNKN